MSLPVLRTERLVLRPRTADDEEALVTAFAGEGEDGAPYTSVDLADPAALRALLATELTEQLGDGLGHCVFEVDGVVAGFGHLAAFRQFPPPFVSIGWALGGGYRGKGLATEAVRELVRHAHETVGVPAVWALIHPDNVPSKRVAERAGFVCVGWQEQLGVQVEVHVALRPGGPDLLRPGSAETHLPGGPETDWSGGLATGSSGGPGARWIGEPGNGRSGLPEAGRAEGPGSGWVGGSVMGPRGGSGTGWSGGAELRRRTSGSSWPDEPGAPVPVGG